MDVNPGDTEDNEHVRVDCNHNTRPDECDIVAANEPSQDCNENGIPDECDIAEEVLHDCNANGRGDECEIAAELVADENENGIPDECEEESQNRMQGAGGEGHSEEVDYAPTDPETASR